MLQPDNQNNKLKDNINLHRAEGKCRFAEFSVGSSLQGPFTFMYSCDPLLIGRKNIQCFPEVD